MQSMSPGHNPPTGHERMRISKMRCPLIATTVLTLVAALAVGFLALSPGPGSASSTPVHIVYVNDIDFCGTSGASCSQPYTINIDPGDEVVFRDGNIGVSHSVTQCQDGNFNNCGGAGSFDSRIQNLPPGHDYFPSALTLAEGTYSYRCNVHLTGMTGVIQVGDAI